MNATGKGTDTPTSGTVCLRSLWSSFFLNARRKVGSSVWCGQSALRSMSGVLVTMDVGLQRGLAQQCPQPQVSERQVSPVAGDIQDTGAITKEDFLSAFSLNFDSWWVSWRRFRGLDFPASIVETQLSGKRAELPPHTQEYR